MLPVAVALGLPMALRYVLSYSIPLHFRLTFSAVICKKKTTTNLVQNLNK